jgi:hypothetical protein
MSLTEARLTSLGRELLKIRNEIAVLRDEVRTAAIAIQTPASHERELLRSTSVIKAKLTVLRPRLEEIAAQIPDLSRRTHRGGSTSAHGHLGNIRGNLPLVERALGELETELHAVQTAVLGVMNDPQRTPSLPTGELSEIVEMGLELVTKLIERFKSRR